MYKLSEIKIGSKIEARSFDRENMKTVIGYENHPIVGEMLLIKDDETGHEEPVKMVQHHEELGSGYFLVIS